MLPLSLQRPDCPVRSLRLFFLLRGPLAMTDFPTKPQNRCRPSLRSSLRSSRDAHFLMSLSRSSPSSCLTFGFVRLLPPLIGFTLSQSSSPSLLFILLSVFFFLLCLHIGSSKSARDRNTSHRQAGPFACSLPVSIPQKTLHPFSYRDSFCISYGNLFCAWVAGSVLGSWPMAMRMRPAKPSSSPCFLSPLLLANPSIRNLHQTLRHKDVPDKRVLSPFPPSAFPTKLI